MFRLAVFCRHLRPPRPAVKYAMPFALTARPTTTAGKWRGRAGLSSCSLFYCFSNRCSLCQSRALTLPLYYYAACVVARPDYKGRRRRRRRC